MIKQTVLKCFTVCYFGRAVNTLAVVMEENHILQLKICMLIHQCGVREKIWPGAYSTNLCDV